MAGQSNAMGNFPMQAPQQTTNMLTNRFTGFNPGQFSGQMPQFSQMGQMPQFPQMNQMAPAVMPPLSMPGQMPNQMAFQNANPMAQLDTRFPMNQMPNMGGMPNQMAFDNANPAANLAARFNPPEASIMPIRGNPNARPF
jgi:hypothetical protein